MAEIESAYLKNLVLKTIEVYNRYRSPKTIAKFISVEKDGFIIDFEGSFFISYGVRDYFEDFIYELKSIKKTLNVELAEIKPTGQQSFRVNFKIIDKYFEFNEDSLFLEFLLERGLPLKEFLASNPCTKDMILFHFRTWLFERNEAAEK